MYEDSTHLSGAACPHLARRELDTCLSLSALGNALLSGFQQAVSCQVWIACGADGMAWREKYFVKGMSLNGRKRYWIG